VVTDRAGAPLQFNAPHPQAAGVVVAAPGLHRALMGGLVVRAEARGALVAVHWVDVEYCLSSPFNPCPEGL
jgi:hypothetical protein